MLTDSQVGRQNRIADFICERSLIINIYTISMTYSVLRGLDRTRFYKREALAKIYIYKMP